MKNYSLKIKSKFNLLLFTIIVATMFLFLVFTLSYLDIQNQKNYQDDVGILYNEYLLLRKHEHQFLLKNNEDLTFFKTGKNVDFRRFETSSSDIIDLISKLEENKLSNKNNLILTLTDLKEALLNYSLLFNEIVNKTYERGSYETGYIGEINRNFDFAYISSQDDLLKKYLDKLQSDQHKYLLNKNIDYYYQFLEDFTSINDLLMTNQTILLDDNINENDTILYLSDIGVNQTYNKELIKSLNSYKRNFVALVTLDQEIGLTTTTGLNSELNAEVEQIDANFETINENLSTYYKQRSTDVYTLFMIVGFSLILFIIIFILLISYSIIKPITKLKNYINPLRKGIIPEQLINLDGSDEITEMSQDLNELISGLKNTTIFASKIGVGVFDTEFNPLSNNDVLGNSLLNMRKNLQEAQIEELKRKEEDSIRKWSNEGITKFSEIMRQRTKNINELSTNVIKNLVGFLNANQGGVFLYNDMRKDDIHLELVASYAYNQERKKKKKIYLGEGLVGTCALEKATIYMTDIPNDYITITSGLGGASPKSILIVPLKVEELILGVIEIASFNQFQKYEIEFIEKVSETIASTLSIAKINQRTAELLEQSQQQAEEMAAQEEEMRQNLEELMATQEEAARRETEMTSLLNAINTAALVIELDINGKILNINNSIVNLFNLSEELLVGNYYATYSNAKVNEIENIQFWERLQNNETIQITRQLNVVGQEIWLHEVYTPIIDANGTTFKILCIATDLTKSKKQERELAIQTEILSAQEEEMRQNLEELQATQEQMKIQQDEIVKSNKLLASNELILRKALEKSKAQEQILLQKNQQIIERSEELSAQEEELRQNMEELSTTQEQIAKQNDEIILANKKLLENEEILKKSLEQSKIKENELSQKTNILLKAETDLKEKARTYRQKLEKLDLELETKDVELFHLKKELERYQDNKK